MIQRIPSLNDFLINEAKYSLEDPDNLKWAGSFTKAADKFQIKPAITVTAVNGVYTEEEYNLEITTSDNRTFKLETYFRIGAPVPSTSANDFARISEGSNTMNMKPDEFINVLEQWGESTPLVLVSALFYGEDGRYKINKNKLLK
ncbi:MAG: hypothetical protein WC979_01315 [Candidatus Pacearchaeota archaeon]|jgi:hypothetical protein|nr:hypothetical protein [Clostridia bacterium]